MKNTVLNYIDRFRHDRHQRAVLGSVLLILATVVTLIVYWQLRYTGITMTNETFCGYEEHVHSDECYESTLICGLEESEGHTHTDECYEEQQVLICALEESAGHTHDETCYDEEGNLICGLEESEGHTHDESCYETQLVLVCELEESEGHVHTDECYEKTLICGYEEHFHTVECLINLEADVEDADTWTVTLPELTGTLSTDVVSIAYSQLGYTESTANFTVSDDGETRYGYTRYGAWYGNAYGDWDAMFVAFCLHYAGIDETVFPVNSGAYAWTLQLTELGSYASASEYTPVAGNLVFLDTDLDERPDRVGIVVAVDDTTLTVIEGNYTLDDADTVALTTYALTDTTISGYGVLPVSETEEESEEIKTNIETEEIETEEVNAKEADTSSEETEAEEPVLEETEVPEETDSPEETTDTPEEEAQSSNDIQFVATDGGVSVTVIAPEGALPDNASLVVTLLDENSSEYASAAEAIGYDSESAESNMAALDITFYDEFGIEVEPTAAVTVSIDITEILPEGTTAETLEVTHITDDAVSTVEPLAETVTDDTDETAVVVFETESFSTFTIEWTVYSSYTADIYVTVWTLEDDSSTPVELSDAGATLNYSVNSGTITISVDDLVSSISSTVLADYEFSYATVNDTYGSSTDSVTSVYTTYTLAFANLSCTCSSTVYTVSNTYSNVLRETNLFYGWFGSIDYYTINLYYTKLPTAELTINKYETNETTQLEDATFRLVSSDALLNDVTAGSSYIRHTDDSTVTFTTTTDPITFDNLPIGSYTLTEVTAPSGYERAAAISFTVDTDGTVYLNDDPTTPITSITVYDEPVTCTLTVSKSYVSENGNALTAGVDDLVATFTLTSDDSTDTPSYSETIDITGEGTIEFTGLAYNGTYILSEASMTGFADVDDITIEVVNGIIYVDSNQIDTAYVANTDNVHPLAGMSYAIANLNSSRDYALTEEVISTGGMSADSVTVVGTDTDGTTIIYGTDTIWTFEAVAGEEDVYYIYTTVGDTTYYLNIARGSTVKGGLYVSTTAQELTVTEGTGNYAGQYRISYDSSSNSSCVNWYGGSNSTNLIFGA